MNWAILIPVCLGGGIIWCAVVITIQRIKAWNAPRPIAPLYYISHPDGTFSVANPQPTLAARSSSEERKGA